ncbi:hypothetical protein DSO57_1007518 [Entomophthora muscae]|uniref:Uncharacterized protein n=1 Tax=Entomophthora muscae TaxID=34485 RepID=A0ACC2UHB0_9FUNG|nr:hypothetical protein DSO57_1007518 [Entomophthora muscae]
MSIKKLPSKQETDRPRRTSLFKFLSRSNSTSTFINTSDVPVTATASNPIRRTPSPTLSCGPESTPNENISYAMDNNPKREVELEHKVDNISRFVVAMIAQERLSLNRAAIKIQSAFRGFQARERIKSFKALEWYSTTLFPPTVQELRKYGRNASHVIDAPNIELRFIMTLQHLVRGFLTRRRYVLVVNYDRAATQIQAAWRGYCARFKPPPNCPPLGGVVRSLATHRLAVQKLAAQIAILNKRIQTMTNIPQQPASGHQLRRVSQASPTINGHFASYSPQQLSSFQPRFASDNPIPKRHASVQSLRSSGSVSFQGDDPSNLSQKSNTQLSSLDQLVSSDSTSNYASSPRGVSRDEYNFVVSEVDSLRAVIDAILLHQNSN